ncbi:MAG: hypothetical protein NDJ89_18410 [Oligoflexia bacterium]|nr:hypothetical protein [Oligoflexia bacterium]
MRLLVPGMIAILSMVAEAGAAPTAAPAPAARATSLYAQARRLLDAQDYLGFRVFLKKAYWKKITYGEWYAIRSMVNSEATNIGFDMIYIWNQRNPVGKSAVDGALEKADALMLEGKFPEAFNEYQRAAVSLRSYLGQLQVGNGPKLYAQRIKDTKALYPYVLHGMGRALYGAGRYFDAIQVYSWITPAYARFRQVLFEKMWAGFRAGKIEVALGSIASQRSAYYSRFLSPESYLIQIYIYRRLCRNEDLDQVLAEMKLYESVLAKGAEADWAGTDLETRVLWGLAQSAGTSLFPTWVTTAEREKEKSEIRTALHRAFERQRPKLLADLKTAKAYAQLASMADTAALKPIERLTSREALLKLDLEIWPADSSEEWVDEVGLHYFTGDSLCNQVKSGS